MFNPGSLLLYKNGPARLVQAGDRLEIEVEGGGMVHVRPKDVTPLHSGPIKNLSELRPMEGEVQAAWEILSGEHTRLADLAELVYGSFTPASAWAAWQLVADGLYFEGSPADIRARSVEEVERKKKDREQAEASQRAWQAFLQRTRKGVYDPVDHAFLRDVENLAFGRGVRSQVLKELGRGETAENAHALLLELGVWDEQVNPYPARLGVGLSSLTCPFRPFQMKTAATLPICQPMPSMMPGQIRQTMRCRLSLVRAGAVACGCTWPMQPPWWNPTAPWTWKRVREGRVYISLKGRSIYCRVR